MKIKYLPLFHVQRSSNLGLLKKTWFCCFSSLWFLLVTTKHFLSFAKEESSQRGTTSVHINKKILTEEKKVILIYKFYSINLKLYLYIFTHEKKFFKFANYHIFFSYFNLTQAILHSLTKSGVIIGN